MDIGVIGERDTEGGARYDNQDYVDFAMDRVMSMYNGSLEDITIVTGGSKGSEKLAEQWAIKRKLPSDTIPPRIKKFEKEPDGMEQAFRERNQRILSRSSFMIFFWDGSRSVIQEALTTCACWKKPLIVFPLL